MSTAMVIGIIVVLVLLGTVINQLLRLKKWLDKAPPGPENPPDSSAGD